MFWRLQKFKTSFLKVLSPLAFKYSGTRENGDLANIEAQKDCVK